MFARFLDTKCYKIQHKCYKIPLSFQLRYDVVQQCTTSHQRWNVVICLRECSYCWYKDYLGAYDLIWRLCPYIMKEKANYLSIYLFKIYLYITRTSKLKYVCIKITTNTSSTQSQLVKSTWKSILRVVRLSLFYCYFEGAKRVN